jgi:hypothetical protein
MHLVADRGEVIKIHHWLTGEAWVEAFWWLSGAGEKPDQHVATARLLSFLGNIAIVATFPGQSRTLHKIKKDDPTDEPMAVM